MLGTAARAGQLRGLCWCRRCDAAASASEHGARALSPPRPPPLPPALPLCLFSRSAPPALPGCESASVEAVAASPAVAAAAAATAAASAAVATAPLPPLPRVPTSGVLSPLLLVRALGASAAAHGSSDTARHRFRAPPPGGPLRHRTGHRPDVDLIQMPSMPLASVRDRPLGGGVLHDAVPMEPVGRSRRMLRDGSGRPRVVWWGALVKDRSLVCAGSCTGVCRSGFQAGAPEGDAHPIAERRTLREDDCCARR